MDNKVIDFITNFITHKKDVKEEGTIITHFRAGYCYYFAVILKVAFKRGEICWAAPFGHMIWVDEDNIGYDIEGEYHGESFYYIPENYLGECLNDFLHKNNRHCASREELISIMKKYCEDKNIVYDQRVESYLRKE